MPVVAMPLTRYFWPKRNTRNTGTRETIDIANSDPHELAPVESTKVRRATGTVYLSGLVRKISWEKKSFQVQMNVKIAVVARAGVASGIITWKKIRMCPAPSSRAASSSSLGMPRKNCTMRNTKNASVARNLGTINGRNVLIQPSWENSTYCGTMTTWIGSMIVTSMIANHSGRSRKFSRANAYAASAQEIRFPSTEPITITKEL